MSNSIVRVNSRSYEETGNTVLPKNPNRTYFFIVFTVGSGTIEFRQMVNSCCLFQQTRTITRYCLGKAWTKVGIMITESWKASDFVCGSLIVLVHFENEPET